VRFIETLNGGESTEVDYDLIADGNANAGLVAIDVELAYEDSFGASQTEIETISLQIIAAPFFQIGLIDPLPDEIVVGDTFDLAIEVINIGRSMINVSTMEVTSDRLMISDGTVYIGPLDGGTSGTIFASAEAIQAGTANIEIKVNYLDSFHQPQSVVEKLTAEVEGIALDDDISEEESSAGREDGDLTIWQRIWRAILGFFGLGTHPPEGASTNSGGLREARPGRGGR
jgi:hypothetical protein